MSVGMHRIWILMADIDFMNKNALEEASNLNNPYPRIRALIGAYPYDCGHLGEYTYLNCLDVSILATRAMASVRRRWANT